MPLGRPPIYREIILTEIEMLQAKIAEAIAQGAAIVARANEIRSWIEIKNRPLHVHREIKRIGRETGDTYDARVAANYVHGLYLELVAEHEVVKERLLSLDAELAAMSETPT